MRLAADPVANTFLIADIDHFGFESGFQKVWLDEAAGAVYLLYYDNLALYAPKPEAVNAAFAAKTAREHSAACVMGRLETVAPLAALLPGMALRDEVFCALDAGQAPRATPAMLAAAGEAQKAAPADADEIHAFLGGFAELAGKYASKEMIAARLAGADGLHLVIRRGGRIAAHGNTAAATAYATMIGGLAAAPEHRGEGLGGGVALALCRRIMAAGARPAALCSAKAYAGFAARLGFKQLCRWGMLLRG